MSFYHWEQADLILAVYIQPRASQTEVVGVYGEQLKIKITAPPVDGQANKAVAKLLAKIFGVAKSQIRLLQGQTHREKLYRIKSPKKLPDFIHFP